MGKVEAEIFGLHALAFYRTSSLYTRKLYLGQATFPRAPY
jgi:hypothetical protein